jgi:CRP-like cAMP-binding protein
VARREASSDGLPDGVADRGFLARLPDTVVEKLVQSSHAVTYPAGSLIEAPAQAGFAVIVSGALRYYLSAADGRQVTVGYLGPGNVIGTVEKQSSGMVRIQVIAPTLLRHIQADRMRALMQERPEMMQALLDEAIAGLRHSFKVLAASAFMSVRARVARDIIERARLAGPLQAGVHLNVTHQALADATGSVREVVARTLRRLSADGVIGARGGVTVLDPDALMRLAGYVT